MNIKKTCSQQLRFNNINHFYCFFKDILEWNCKYMGNEEYNIVCCHCLDSC